MLFRKRRKPKPSYTIEGKRNPAPPDLGGYEITFEMMLKGAKVLRNSRTVRQATVMVGTNVCLVTSGDTVDRPTYEALLAASVISPPQGDLPGMDDAPPDSD